MTVTPACAINMMLQSLTWKKQNAYIAKCVKRPNLPSVLHMAVFVMWLWVFSDL